MQDVEFKQAPLLDGWAIAAGVGLVALGVGLVVLKAALIPALAVAAVLFLIVGLLLGMPRAPATAVAPQPDQGAQAAPFTAPAPLMAAPAERVTPVPLMAAPAVAPVPATPETPAPLGISAQRPVSLNAARGGSPDDLKQIKGVGPVLERLLHTLGFFHFDQIASWTAAEVAWVDDNLEGFKGRVTRDGWVAQARILAAGGTTEHSRRVAEGKMDG